jgi:hypothetical protein
VGTERNPRRWRWIAALSAAALALGLAVWLGRSGKASTAPVTPPAGAPGPVLIPHPSTAPSAPSAGAGARTDRRKQLLDQVQLADHTYCSYRHATDYPPGSRPISEQPDQIFPNVAVTDTQPMREEGGRGNPKVQIQSSQSRVHLAAGESVLLALRALDEDGAVLPLVVTGAQAQGLVFDAARPAPQVTLPFHDDGAGGDAAAQDGTHSAVLTPAQGALAGFEGTIRTRVRYSVAGKAGALVFDVVYTPQAPAVWTGQVREALEDGALNFYLKLDVRQAGRYVVNARVDDARGTPLALLTFNDLLPAGPNEVKLSLFGKLVRDHTPAMPLSLRDVDAYLLREDADPDRATMARLTGRIHTSRAHPLGQFSDAEWTSPERTRYLNELGMDMNRARAALSQFDPTVVLPPPCKAGP